MAEPVKSASEFEYATATAPRVITRMAGHALIYGALTILIRLGNFIVLPIYLRHVDPAGYGILGITDILLFVFPPILTLSLEAAVVRFYFEWPEAERSRKVGALWGLLLLNAAMCGAMLLAAGYFIWPLAIKNVPFWPYVPVVMGTLLAQSIILMPLALLRIREQSRLYLAYNLAVFVLSSAAGLYCVVGRDMGVLGIQLGTLVGYGTMALVSGVAMSLTHPPNLDRKPVAPAIDYALPVLPTAILFGVPRILDRFFLDRFVPLAEIGLYSLGANFGNVILTSQTALKTAWVPAALRVGTENPEGRRIIGKMGKLYVMGVLALSLGVAMLAREFILWANPVKYGPAINLVPVFAGTAFLATLDILSFTSFSLAKKMTYDIAIGVFQVVIGSLLMWWLVVSMGLWGALLAYFSMRAATALLRFSISLRVFPIPYELGRIALGVVLAVGAWFAGTLLHPMSLPVAVIGKLGILSIWGLACVVLVLGGFGEVMEVLKARKGVAK